MIQIYLFSLLLLAVKNDVEMGFEVEIHESLVLMNKIEGSNSLLNNQRWSLSHDKKVIGGYIPELSTKRGFDAKNIDENAQEIGVYIRKLLTAANNRFKEYYPFIDKINALNTKRIKEFIESCFVYYNNYLNNPNLDEYYKQTTDAFSILVGNNEELVFKYKKNIFDKAFDGNTEYISKYIDNDDITDLKQDKYTNMFHSGQYEQASDEIKQTTNRL